MDISWVSVEEVKNSFPKTPNSRLVEIDKLLKVKYPLSLNWIETDISEKEPIKNVITDIQHILTWAWKKRIFVHQHYSDKVKEYILSGHFNHLNLTLTNFALNKNMIDLDLITEIDTKSPDYNRYLRKAVILLCLFTMKPFQKLTDEDLFKQKKLLKEVSNKQIDSFKAVQELRVKLGYSSKIIKNKQRNTNWIFLKNRYPNFKQTINSYHNYLISSELSESSIKGKSIQLKQFLEYSEKNGIKTFRYFRRNDFLRYFESLKGRYKNNGTFNLQISNFKTFFIWGAEIEVDVSLFPKVLEFPLDYHKKITKIANKEYHNSQGHSFENEHIGKEFVKALMQYKPKNETDKVALNFMLILCSVPCRRSYVRNLPKDCLFYMENSKELYGVTNTVPDKSGNINGQFPILDKMGLDSIRWLQYRAESKEFKPIENMDNKKTYVHLFQVDEHPHVLTDYYIDNLIDAVRNEMPEEFQQVNITPHKFRTQILTEITARTRNIEVTQTAAGHRNSTMTKTYLRSDISQDALLNTIKEGFDKGEFSGKFYLRLIEALTSDDISNDEILIALNKEISLNEFLKQFGRRRDMGYCLIQGDCANHYKCWGCKHFFMKRDEIETAIETLSKHLINFRALMEQSKDFTFENPIVASKQKAIGLIIKHICNLGYSPEQVLELVGKHLKGQALGEVLVNE